MACSGDTLIHLHTIHSRWGGVRKLNYNLGLLEIYGNCHLCSLWHGRQLLGPATAAAAAATASAAGEDAAVTAAAAAVVAGQPHDHRGSSTPTIPQTSSALPLLS